MSVSRNRNALGQMKGQENRAEYARVSNLEFVMSSTEGRAFVYDLIYRRAGLETVTREGEKLEVQEGKRSVGAGLMLDLRSFHTSRLLQMQQEGVLAEHNARAAHEAAASIDGDENE